MFLESCRLCEWDWKRQTSEIYKGFRKNGRFCAKDNKEWRKQQLFLRGFIRKRRNGQKSMAEIEQLVVIWCPAVLSDLRHWTEATSVARIVVLARTLLISISSEILDISWLFRLNKFFTQQSEGLTMCSFDSNWNYCPWILTVLLSEHSDKAFECDLLLGIVQLLYEALDKSSLEGLSVAYGWGFNSSHFSRLKDC